MAPQGCFISAEAIEREVGQICQTQKPAAGSTGGWLICQSKKTRAVVLVKYGELPYKLFEESHHAICA